MGSRVACSWLQGAEVDLVAGLYPAGGDDLGVDTGTGLLAEGFDGDAVVPGQGARHEWITIEWNRSQAREGHHDLTLRLHVAVAGSRPPTTCRRHDRSAQDLAQTPWLR